MGQQANPTSLRLKISRNWESEWYAKNKYSIYLQEDLFIRNYLYRKFDKLYTALGSCIIQRSANNTLTITLIGYAPRKVHLYFRARLFILEVLSQLTNMVIHLNVQRFYKRRKKLYRKITTKKGKRLRVIDRRRKKQQHHSLPFRWKRYIKLFLILKMLRTRPNAELLANYLKKEIQRNPRQTQLIQFLKKFALDKKYYSHNTSSPVLGIKIQFKGRLNGRPRARKLWVQTGSVPLNTLIVPVQYAAVHALTRTGTCGIKVWIAFKRLPTIAEFRKEFPRDTFFMRKNTKKKISPTAQFLKKRKTLKNSRNLALNVVKSQCYPTSILKLQINKVEKKFNKRLLKLKNIYFPPKLKPKPEPKLEPKLEPKPIQRSNREINELERIYKYQQHLLPDDIKPVSMPFLGRKSKPGEPPIPYRGPQPLMPKVRQLINNNKKDYRRKKFKKDYRQKKYNNLNNKNVKT